MAAKKTHDLTVRVGTYVNGQGDTKNRYKNVGMVLQKEDGGEIILIDPLINFAAVPREDGRDMVIVSKFEIKDDKKPAASATPAFEE